MSTVSTNSNILNLSNYTNELVSRKSGSSKDENAVASAQNQKVTEREVVASLSSENLADAINTLNQVPVIKERNLSFSIDDLSGRSVIKLRDKKTDEVIKQIPSEELLKVAQDVKRLQEQMGQSIGLLVDNKV